MLSIFLTERFYKRHVMQVGKPQTIAMLRLACRGALKANISLGKSYKLVLGIMSKASLISGAKLFRENDKSVE